MDEDTSALVFTRYSAISFLSHLRTYIPPLCPVLMAGQSTVGSSIASISKWTRSISVLLKDPSKNDLENNRQKQFNTNRGEEQEGSFFM